MRTLLFENFFYKTLFFKSKEKKQKTLFSFSFSNLFSCEVTMGYAKKREREKIKNLKKGDTTPTKFTIFIFFARNINEWKGFFLTSFYLLCKY